MGYRSEIKKLFKYYTKPEIAKKLFNNFSKEHFYVEPSAGCGYISSLLPKRRSIALDICPEGEGIIQLNFLEFSPKTKRLIITVGNPPFGKNGSLAVKFFNKSAEFSEEIHFILPKSFRKESVQRRLNPFFHLEHDETLPPYSFLLEGESYDVPCCFQIWKRRPEKRKPILPKKLEGVTFVKTEDQANIIIRRVGGRAGQVLEGSKFSPSSTYFLLIENTDLVEALKKTKGTLCPEVLENTAGVRSVSKPELLEGILHVKRTLGKQPTQNYSPKKHTT